MPEMLMLFDSQHVPDDPVIDFKLVNELCRSIGFHAKMQQAKETFLILLDLERQRFDSPDILFLDLATKARDSILDIVLLCCELILGQIRLQYIYKFIFAQVYLPHHSW